MTGKPLLFHQTAEQLRRVSALVKSCHLFTAASTYRPSPSISRARLPVLAQAISVLPDPADQLFISLRGVGGDLCLSSKVAPQLSDTQ